MNLLQLWNDKATPLKEKQTEIDELHGTGYNAIIKFTFLMQKRH